MRPTLFFTLAVVLVAVTPSLAAEAQDVSEQHPEIVKELEALLQQQRDAGHPRELPRTHPASSEAPLQP